MILDKIIPSFCIIELHGDSVKSIFKDEFGISEVRIVSGYYDTDIRAINAVMESTEKISKKVHMNEDSEEEIHFNPEFFPTASAYETNDENTSDELEEMPAIINQLLSMHSGVAITNKFDKYGDFIQFKMILTTEDAKIEARTGSNPIIYANLKAADNNELLNKDKKIVLQ